MEHAKKQLIQSAAIRLGIGIAAVLIARLWLTEQEIYQKACYMIGYFFMAYPCIRDLIMALSKKKFRQWELWILLVILLTSVILIALKYYTISMLLAGVAVLWDIFRKRREV